MKKALPNTDPQYSSLFTLPQASVISWLATALQGRDMSFEQDVLPEAMLATGFVSVRSRTLNDIEVEAHGPVDMHVARKSKE